MSMIPKSGNRFSDKIMLQMKCGMIPKSGNRFSENIMLLKYSKHHAQVKA
jgi:hypothetical protein